MKEGDESLEQLLRALDVAYYDSPEPPPHYREPGAAGWPTGVDDAQIDRWRRDLQELTGTRVTLGQVLCRRREALGIDTEELATQAHWKADRVEAIEQGVLGLHEVEPERLARLLAPLRITSIKPLEPTLRDLARQHLTVYEDLSRQVYGRSRKGVSSHQRRRDLLRGVAATDDEATARAADRYLKAVQAELDLIWTSRSL
jgi:hypothetical protein